MTETDPYRMTEAEESLQPFIDMAMAAAEKAGYSREEAGRALLRLAGANLISQEGGRIIDPDAILVHKVGKALDRRPRLRRAGIRNPVNPIAGVPNVDSHAGPASTSSHTRLLASSSRTSAWQGAPGLHQQARFLPRSSWYASICTAVSRAVNLR